MTSSLVNDYRVPFWGTNAGRIRVITCRGIRFDVAGFPTGSAIRPGGNSERIAAIYQVAKPCNRARGGVVVGKSEGGRAGASSRARTYVKSRIQRHISSLLVNSLFVTCNWNCSEKSKIYSLVTSSVMNNALQCRFTRNARSPRLG